MTRQEAGGLVAVLMAAFPRQSIEPETAKAYTTFLEDLDREAASEAVKQLIASSTFFPTIAEIREAAAELRLGLPGAVGAWELVAERARQRPEKVPCAPCRSTGFAGGNLDGDALCPECGGEGAVWPETAPLPEAVARALAFIGGPQAIRESENLAVLRAHFRDAYRELRAKAVNQVAVGELLPPRPELRAIEGGRS